MFCEIEAKKSIMICTFSAEYYWNRGYRRSIYEIGGSWLGFDGKFVQSSKLKFLWILILVGFFLTNFCLLFSKVKSFIYFHQIHRLFVNFVVVKFCGKWKKQKKHKRTEIIKKNYEIPNLCVKILFLKTIDFFGEFDPRFLNC